MSAASSPEVAPSGVVVGARRSWGRRLVKVALWSVVAFTAFVAFAHTPWGRPLLAMLSGVPGCPAGLDGGDAASVEATRAASVVMRSGAVEVTPKALVFVLGSSTRDEVRRWLGEGAERCVTIRDGQGLRCEGAALAKTELGCEADLHLTFAGEVLVGLDVRRNGQAEEAVRWLGERVAQLGALVGDPARSHGEAEVGWLVSAPMRQVAREFRARGFVAQVSVTHLGPRGVSTREQYQWVAM